MDRSRLDAERITAINAAIRANILGDTDAARIHSERAVYYARRLRETPEDPFADDYGWRSAEE